MASLADMLEVLVKKWPDQFMASDVAGMINNLPTKMRARCDLTPARKSSSKKSLQNRTQLNHSRPWQYRFLTVALAGASVASVPVCRKCPPTQRFSHTTGSAARANHSCAYDIGVSRLAQCPVRAIIGTVARGKA